MTLLTYDGSFEGLLTAIFTIYEERIQDPQIGIAGKTTGLLFTTQRQVITDFEKSDRVNKKIRQIISPKSYFQLFKSFLSERQDIGQVIYRYVQFILKSKGAGEYNYSNNDVLQVQQLSKKVEKEKHRMKAFVRFQLTKDGMYYAMVQPDYNVLPIIASHFKGRYADQRWLIYDVLRKYGIYYDLATVHEVRLDFATDINNTDALAAIHDETESLYQALWNQYFQSVNIEARKNTALHIMHMPKRYWKYLVEKRQ